MKVKDGQLKLDSNEKRVGNFVIKHSGDYVKLCDVSRVFIWSVRTGIPLGKFLVQAYRDFKDEQTTKGIGNYIAVLWSAFSVVPDVQFLEEVYKSAEDCMKRHPEAYGFPSGEATEKDDAEALRSVEEMHRLEEDMRKLQEQPKQ